VIATLFRLIFMDYFIFLFEEGGLFRAAFEGGLFRAAFLGDTYFAIHII